MILNLIGLVCNLTGVVLLFIFGMPFHVPTEGKTFVIVSQRDEADIAKEARFKMFGGLGLGLIIVGTGFQLLATWLP